MERIPVAGPWITQKEIQYVADAVEKAWYGNANMYNDRFESEFARYLGVRFAVSLPSCTSALHLSLLALGIGPGDEVIVPDATWTASAAPVHYVGATAVFADIDEASWCLSAASFDECITSRTKAVIPVDLYGNMPDMEALQRIAARNNIPIIEDAAEAIGTEYRGRRAGTFGRIGTFSFHGSKTLTTGEGGMLVTEDEDVCQRVLMLRDHGRKPGDRMFWNTEIGYKYKMSSLQAALGLAQLERIDELIDRKRCIFSWYCEYLGQDPRLTLNQEAPGVKNTYWMVTAVLDERIGITKEEVLQGLQDPGIDCRPFFYPLCSLPAYENSVQVAPAQRRNRVSYAVSSRAINLPSALSLTREQVCHVCQELTALLARADGSEGGPDRLG